MTGPEWVVIYGTGFILSGIIAARFVMHELTAAVRQFKELKSCIRGEVKELPPGKKENGD
jgi:hypothetical protein